MDALKRHREDPGLIVYEASTTRDVERIRREVEGRRWAARHGIPTAETVAKDPDDRGWSAGGSGTSPASRRRTSRRRSTWRSASSACPIRASRRRARPGVRLGGHYRFGCGTAARRHRLADLCRRAQRLRAARLRHHAAQRLPLRQRAQHHRQPRPRHVSTGSSPPSVRDTRTWSGSSWPCATVVVARDAWNRARRLGAPRRPARSGDPVAVAGPAHLRQRGHRLAAGAGPRQVRATSGALAGRARVGG